MNKAICVLVGMLLCVSTAFAQQEDLDFDGDLGVIDDWSSALFFGPKAGATFTSMTDPNEATLYDSFGLGFSGGLVMRTRFGKSNDSAPCATGLLGLQLGLRYKQNVCKTTGSDDLSIGYFEVPLLIQLYPFYKSASNVLNTLYIEAGAAFAGTMSASPDVLEVSDAGVSYYTGDLKGYDVRPAVGLGVSFPLGTGGQDRHTTQALDINLRYAIGTSELAKNFPVKMNTFEVSIAWLFNIKKF